MKTQLEQLEATIEKADRDYKKGKLSPRQWGEAMNVLLPKLDTLKGIR